jgi:hypothetical protein
MKRMITTATLLLALLAKLLGVTVVPGSSILDLNIDVGTKVLAVYVAYMGWAALTVLLVNVFFISPASESQSPQPPADLSSLPGLRCRQRLIALTTYPKSLARAHKQLRTSSGTKLCANPVPA